MKSLFTSTKWRVLQLDIQELFRLWNYSDYLITSLAGRHEKLFWENNSIPLRVLGVLLRFLLSPVWRTEVVDNETSVVVIDCVLVGDNK